MAEALGKSAYSALPQRHRIAIGLALSTIVFGIVVTLGHAIGSERLIFRYQQSAVAPNTAFLFVLTALATLLYIARLDRTAVAVSATIEAISTSILLYRITHPFPLHLGFIGKANAFDSLLLFSTRVSIPTACCFLVIGLALLFVRKRKTWIVDAACVSIAAVSLFSVLGFLFGMPYLYTFVMALATAVAMMVQAVALACIADSSYVREALCRRDGGGMVLRRLSAVVLIVLPALGVICRQLEMSGVVPNEFGFTLLVFAGIMFLIALALLIAGRLSSAEKRTLAANEALVRTEKLATAGRLAATVAHEINNPLAAALNSLYIARMKTEGSGADEYLDVAERELKRVAAVVRQSLGFYRGEGKSTVFSVTSLLKEAIDILQPMATSKRVRMEFSGDDGISVLADPGELRQIACNLIANAIDATDPDGRVTVSCDRTDRRSVRITIEDTGSGIPVEAREKMFEPFFTTKSAVGSGLGLFVVKELVHKNKGSLTFATSTEDVTHGTEFVIEFPAIGDQRVAKSAS